MKIDEITGPYFNLFALQENLEWHC